MRRYIVDPSGIVGGDKFIELCEMLGRVLATRQHQVFLLSDNDQHADTHLLRGYATYARGTATPPIRVSFGDSSDPENQVALKFREARAKMPHVVFEDVDILGNYPFNRVELG